MIYDLKRRGNNMCASNHAPLPPSSCPSTVLLRFVEVEPPLWQNRTAIPTGAKGGDGRLLGET